MCKTAVFFGKELAKYGFGGSHPFNSNRIYSFWSKFNTMNLDKSDKIIIEKPEIAQEEILLQFHDKKYVDMVKESSKKGIGFLDHGDTPSFKGVFEASCYVVGSSLKALDLVMEKKDGILHAFNPIGGLHHARRGSAGGFCVFNDIGILIMNARKKYGINRISYVDIDAHHGDGVFYEFEKDPAVFIADIHENGRYLYPGTGKESETGSGDAISTKLNLPLKPNSGDDDFIAAFKKVEEFIDNIAKPELMILQCGADGIAGDPLTHLQYTSKSHRYTADKLHQLSHKYNNGKIIALGGGGYNQTNIAEGWTEVVRSFIKNI
ncbi:MAG: acetoin utilization protein AcuC [Thermoproteota archaeon]|nr:acetoin utilization protein AcuC [Thermoproteota archaeon]